MTDKNGAPVVSIVMAAHNEDICISVAIQSIIDQTFGNWEFIIVDDCSSDRTDEIVREFQKNDGRIKLIANNVNIGLAASLNRGIASAKGKYIARMDADDVSYPDRLRLQKVFLDNNSDVSVVGGNADLIYENGNRIRSTSMPESHDSIKNVIVRMNPMIHPSVMYRRTFIERMGGYDERLRRKQDYDLWLRGIKSHVYANINDVIIRYRVQPSKPISTDLYGFYVRVLNAHRRKNYLIAVPWAVVILGMNIMRKFGYKQRMHRSTALLNREIVWRGISPMGFSVMRYRIQLQKHFPYI